MDAEIFEYDQDFAKKASEWLTKQGAGGSQPSGAGVGQPSGLDNTLNERGKRYGQFKYHAKISQDLKSCMKSYEGWDKLLPDQVEALEMIAHKIARILNGDPNYDDSWHDIAGYATLVAERLRGNDI